MPSLLPPTLIFLRVFRGFHGVIPFRHIVFRPSGACFHIHIAKSIPRFFSLLDEILNRSPVSV